MSLDWLTWGRLAVRTRVYAVGTRLGLGQPANPPTEWTISCAACSRFARAQVWSYRTSPFVKPMFDILRNFFILLSMKKKYNY